MKAIYIFKALLITIVLALTACDQPNNEKVESVKYGDNPDKGQYINSQDSQIYYETYGNPANQPLILIHGNSGSIAAMQLQIDFFKEDYYVVVADNRTHGKSGGDEKVSYKMMAKDYMNIVNHLNLETVYVLGHSDGGIIGLLMAIIYPNKVSKLVSAVPNLVPGKEAIAEWELEMGTGYMNLINSMLETGDTSRDWKLEKIHMDLMKNHPNITKDDLKRITCPVLVMTSDDDIIKPRHILEIYENIPHAQLFVMPGATHFMIRDEHELYNQMANRFLTQPFKRPRSEQVLKELIGFGQE